MMPNGNSLEVGVIGAGTAGLATAIALARAGYAVTVFEKHRALAPLGAGILIQPQALRRWMRWASAPPSMRPACR